MIGYTYGDGGRKEARYRGSAGDCVARALAILTGESYEQVYLDLALANKEAGYRGRPGTDCGRRSTSRSTGSTGWSG